MSSRPNEDQIVENVTESTFGMFENVTKSAFKGFENITSDIISNKHTTDLADITNPVENFIDGVETTNISLVEVRNRTLVEIENLTNMEIMDAPAPEFM